MPNIFRRSLGNAALLALLGMTTSAMTGVISTSVSAQDTAPSPTPVSPTPASPTPPPGTAINFPDVPPDYWAQPFIQALAARNIITGFPDGTFRPQEAVDRAEFAAMVQKAFNQNPVRQLSPGGFKDVPADYWAIDAIREAYETGFLSGYPGDLFQPNQEIPKVQAIVALVNGLGLTPTGTVANVLETSYTDVGAIPNYALDDVAAATEANFVVNYPDVKVLNPLLPLSRAEAAALLYQALVRQGQLQPIPSNVAAGNYIVGRTTDSTQTAQPAQTTPTPTATTLTNVLTSNNSFTTLTSLVQAAGLASILQEPGPFTIFAPTDQAFADLPKGTVERLLQPENKEILTRILGYHILPGQATASQLYSGRARTLIDRRVNLKVNQEANQVIVGGADVVQPNIQASNGIIHAIDELLIPPGVNLKKIR